MLNKNTVVLYVFALICLQEASLSAQKKVSFLTGREPRGVQVYEMAMTPSMRKWEQSQSFYHFYKWTGDGYANYATENYQRYVSTELEGFRTYDMYGNYVTRGFSIYNWTIDNPLSSGTSVRKAPKFGGWFRNLVVSSMSKGGFYSSLMIGDAIRTRLTPLTFNKPAFNGIQWDFSSDRFEGTLITSRVAAPGTVVMGENALAQRLGDVTNLFGGHAKIHLTDFSNLGFTYLNIANFSSARKLGRNSLKGVLTGDQNEGQVETVVLRLTDDSPEDGIGGARLFSERVVINGVEHPEIVPTLRGGVRDGGVIEANGVESIELTYNIASDLQILTGDQIESFQEIRDIQFELAIANDYKLEVTSNLQVNSQDEPVFLLVERAHGNVSDGSNLRYVTFDYGLPTGRDIIGVNFNIDDANGFNLRSEWAVSRAFRRFPNQNFQKHRLAKDDGVAYYVTASQDSYPYFAYGEIYRTDPEYSTRSFMSDTRGFVDYENVERYTFEAIDDNDDQDRFPDWQRLWQGGDFVFGTTPFGTGGLPDPQVFPGYDENADFISDFNQNDNTIPDYDEPFVRYLVDDPEFLFGVDMNNNGIIDRFENDDLADLPYRQDRRGWNTYGGVNFNEHVRFTVGGSSVAQISSNRDSEQLYAIVQGDWLWSGLEIKAYEYVRSVKDNIEDSVLFWIDPDGFREVEDRLEMTDALASTGYFTLDYKRLGNLNLYNKVKYDFIKQRGDEADLKNDRLFLGLVNRIDYPISVSKDVQLWPRWKGVFRKINPAFANDLQTTEWSHYFMLTSKYSIIPSTYLEYGVEVDLFRNLEEKPEIVPAGYEEDFNATVLAIQLANRSSYLGYALTMNAGFRLERRNFEDRESESRSLVFLRAFAGLSDN
ncbi:MAG: hypothetical protein VX294_04300 [Candidatus Latescibacterota bacterium]|nr:hypothetical protein [Candidatus Latescibacterota bacterium]